MKKKLMAAGLAAAVLGASLTGCQSKPAETTAAETTAAETTKAETEASSEAETTKAETEAAEKPYEGTTLNVMLAYGGAEAAFDAFTEKTGIKVEYVEISTGKALAQLQAENGNTTADIWFGGGVDSYISATDLGYLEQYVSPEAEAINPAYSDADGYWTGLALVPAGFLVNNDVLAEKNLEAPKTWEDLADPKYKGEIIMASPAISGTQYAILNGTIQAYGEEKGWEVWKGINENVARTLEYAYDDWCIAQVAKMLGKDEDAKRLEKASQNYRNVFDPEMKLMRGRNADGTFQTPFSPYKWGDAFTEGNSWHYTWSVFHDVEGLVDLMGGREQFVQMLDSVFVVPPIYDDSYYGFRIHEITEMQVANMGNYAHGNQPAQHMIYLYDYCGQPHKAQWWVREVMDRLYSAKPDGYCGDEDNGQTSAWYAFSALGFYPVCPASDEYAVGSPLFKHATIHLENGNDIVIEAPENSPENRYVGSMTFDGEELEKPCLKYSELKMGAKILFDMQAQK